MTEPHQIRVVLAGSKRMFREGLRLLCQSDPEIVVVGDAADAGEVIRIAGEASPDVVLLDATGHASASLDMMRDLAASLPQLRVALIADTVEGADVTTALQVGARGVVLADSPLPLLFKAIRAVARGEYWIGRASVADLVDTLRRMSGAAAQRNSFGLTPRELEIVAAVVTGETNRAIATRLGVSEDTVKHHLTHIFDKLGVFSRVELALFAMRHKLVPDQTVSTL